ncbi:MAG TPA: type II toxin-antitoxin system VapC family toxin [Phycicoccus sp.]|nr:type II toxin-antitoxin system VapC family toxin [Phycicoccus sp.]HQH06309.1 type II toxin-antitoxin system VapC family toxin [Phycicoccus sp.]HQK30632.1 type II toxin-antitoxin system VapC family toxin [Phycicoccus sp.]
MLLALDTTVLIDHLRGRPVIHRIDQLLDRGVTLATTAINVEEIVRGLRDGEHTAAEGLFAGLAVLPITADAAWRAGEWRRQFAARGVTLWQADCLIGATALTHGADLATGNPKDFPMEELVVQHWPVGE